MCGIYGLASLKKDDLDQGEIGRIGAALAHRGPDGEGCIVSDRIVLGHRRLSIIDLATGAQPIFNEDKTIAIVLNGEIYNFHELRAKLLLSGHVFRTHSDTEVIIHLYEQYGYNCLHHLKGMFAFAIWDANIHTLFLARDRFGIKPLLYYFDKVKFAFSSEINPLFLIKDINKVLDYESLSYYLSFNYIPAPHTIYQGIKKLEPGYFLTVKISNDKINCQKKKYYDLAAISNGNNINDISEAKYQLRIALEHSVQDHMVSDVSLGAFLSGGIDSSIIVGLMARSSQIPIKTFSIGYKDYNLFDETAFARKVASFNHTDHHEIKLSYKDVLDAIPLVLDSLGEPLADWSIFPTFLISKETRKYVKVALSGDGADEIFGGYRKYLGEYFARAYMSLPESLRKSFLEVIVNSLPDSFNNRLLEHIRRAKRFVGGIGASPEERHFKWMEIFTEEAKNLICRRELSGYHPQALVSGFFKRYNGDLLNKMFYTDLMSVLPDDMLAKVDHMSMLNGLEVRVPYLDHKLVELSFSMPGSFKLTRFKRKYVLIETFKDILPRELHYRNKQGFDVPMGEWFKKELRDLFWDVMNKKTIQQNGILRYDYIKQVYNMHCYGKGDYSKQLFNLFVFQWWINKNNPILP